MSLRIVRHSSSELPQGQQAERADDWGSRVAKLIPAEALGLYGTAVGLVASMQGGNAAADPLALWVIVAASCALIVLIRFRATREAGGTAPQVIAIAIAVISFLIWLAALGASGQGVSPIAFPGDRPWPAPLAAFLWGTFVPYFYKGD